MAVVELCDRMVSQLAPLLTAGRTKITIQHRNVGERHGQSAGRASHQDPAKSSRLVPSPSPGTSPPLAHLLLTLQPSPHSLHARASWCRGTSHAVDCKRIVRNLWVQETT